MIHLAGRSHILASTESTISDGNRRLPPQSQSFAAELSSKLADARKNDSRAARLPTGLPAGHQSVAWRDPGRAGGLSGLVISYPSMTSGTATGAEASAHPTASFDDAYWAKQPTAVQQLRNIQDPAEKTQLATKLAQQGYSIDVPIMVWGWDPAIATQLRQSQGYTWVPSALQQPVEVAPGLSVPGLPSYDPAHPPAGSITV
jgi:hypothetical protein